MFHDTGLFCIFLDDVVWKKECFMKNMRGKIKKYVSIFLIFTLLIVTIVVSNDMEICMAEEKPKESELYAKAAVLMDADSGRVLYSKNGREALANASTTKILTCILALESGKTDEIVTASARAARAPKVHLGMQEGQKFYMKDLLYALMLESFNDCAVAIAEHVSGSVEEFAILMNEKAEEVGCKDTYFITPNGLDGSDKKGFHHTTAEDLALLMKYCILESKESENFLQITGTANYNFCEVDSGRMFNCYNRNTFLTMMEGAFSGKTGFTGDAGYCYVGALKRDGKTYIVALLACGWPNNKTYKWKDAKKLMQYGIDQFEKVDLTGIPFAKEKLQDVYVENGQGTFIGEPVYTSLYVKEKSGLDEVLMSRDEEIKISYQINHKFTAPLPADTYAGRIVLSSGEEILKEYEVYTASEVKVIDFNWCIRMLWAYFTEGIYI